MVRVRVRVRVTGGLPVGLPVAVPVPVLIYLTKDETYDSIAQRLQGAHRALTAHTPRRDVTFCQISLPRRTHTVNIHVTER